MFTQANFSSSHANLHHLELVRSILKIANGKNDVQSNYTRLRGMKVVEMNAALSDTNWLLAY